MLKVVDNKEIKRSFPYRLGRVSGKILVWGVQVAVMVGTVLTLFVIGAIGVSFIGFFFHIGWNAAHAH